jgi:malonyl-CoA O-methyltransferase
MTKANRVRSYFDQAASAYSQKSDAGAWALFRRWESQAVLELLRPEAGERILDAGSGSGFYSGLLKGGGCVVTALDFSAPMLDHVAQRLAIPTILGDLQQSALPANFDRVLCAGALEFVSDPRAAVANLASALRPTGPGVMVFLLPRAGALPRFYRAFHRRHGFQVNLFDRGAVECLASNAGMRITAWRRPTFNWVCRLERL